MKALPGKLRREIPALVRFQPVGIMQSRCYTESDGAFSCVNCHEPHSRSTSDRKAYELACLECHRAGPQPTCPVAPESGCIDCHMPRIDSGQNILFTDHWIRVRNASDPPPVRSGDPIGGGH